ncbi:hypothetical protein BC939DRAFT_459047 [Gamsiella multidivaricata]|uniref:uncharacterized protein n=1 Tax=Gamsiella multidivaricata TaxID=101098 RepID=UPI002220D89E|nr:uncharacterized protein BC939DRAFT_459047 [Gamsiella multidivaricata]KAI7819936.1 hypothetical protein BC939DRAFT_459047 [Gamsiella multidivaricata]
MLPLQRGPFSHHAIVWVRFGRRRWGACMIITVIADHHDAARDIPMQGVCVASSGEHEPIPTIYSLHLHVLHVVFVYFVLLFSPPSPPCSTAWWRRWWGRETSSVKMSMVLGRNLVFFFSILSMIGPNVSQYLTEQSELPWAQLGFLEPGPP